jgi:Cu(I)/Ag(I) efflux system membrane protein CusA/SilA
MVENLHKHLERADGPTDRWELVYEASRQVGPALFFSLLIVTASFLPVFALEQQEGRLFHPLAFTKTFAMLGAALLSVTLVPVLMGYLIRGRILPEERNPLNRFLQLIYQPVLSVALSRPWLIIAAAATIVGVTVVPWRQLGREFMPPLDEGAILFMPTTVPGASIGQARGILQYQDSVLATFPEVASVFGKAGRANTATDPAPLDMIETTIMLKPPSEWRPGMTMDRLVSAMDSAVRLPGVSNAWTMPIKGRIDMLATGVRTPVGVKIYGPSLDTLQLLGGEVERILQQIPGTRSAFAERSVSGYYVDIEIDRAQAARYGLTTGMIHDAVMATVGGTSAAVTVEGRERYEVNVRYPRERRDDIDALTQVMIPAMDGTQIPLGQLARIHPVQGPMAVKTENAFPLTTVYVDLDEGQDIGTYVDSAQEAVAAGLTLPQGYTLAWSGQFEFMERVRDKLTVMIPVTLMIIVLLLYLSLGGVAETLIVMVSVPFALVGGVWYLWLAGFNTSTAVWVGFIALAGIAAETGVVMLVYLNEAFDRRKAAGQMRTRADLVAAVREGALERLRPKVMTVAADIFGLAPILLGAGTGTDVMQRIAAPLVGGLVTSTLLTLLVIPAMFLLWKSRVVSRES